MITIDLQILHGNGLSKWAFGGNVLSKPKINQNQIEFHSV